VSFSFRLGFTGLCAFVPHPGGDRARVLLLGCGEDGGHCHDGHGAHPCGNAMEPHVPALVFEKRFFAGGNRRQPDITFFHDTVEWGLCLLANLDLEILSNSTSPFTMESPGVGPTVCPSGTDLSRLSWVAPIEKLRPGAGHVTESCLDSDGSKVPRDIVARVRIDRGTLSTRELTRTNGQIIQWQFAPLTGGDVVHRQALAEVVELALDEPGDQIVLSARPFRGVGRAKRIALAPTAGSNEVVAMVKCIPIEDVFGLRPVEPVRFGDRRSRDQHFEHYYRISAADPGVGLGPVPEAAAACPATAPGFGPPLATNPMCPPSWFEPSAAA